MVIATGFSGPANLIGHCAENFVILVSGDTERLDPKTFAATSEVNSLRGHNKLIQLQVSAYRVPG